MYVGELYRWPFKSQLCRCGLGEVVGGRGDPVFAVTTTFLQIIATRRAEGEIRIQQGETDRGLILHPCEKGAGRKQTQHWDRKQELCWGRQATGCWGCLCTQLLGSATDFILMVYLFIFYYILRQDLVM